MSDLQISLLIIGAVVVGAVYLFNWVQERKFRRSFDAAFDAERDDVLLDAPGQVEGRVEPQLPVEPLAVEPPEATAPSQPDTMREAAGPQHGMPAAEFDPALDYVAEIEAEGPIPASLVAELLSRVAATGKPYRAAGLDTARGQWQDLVRGGGDHYARLRVALQLVSRNGAVGAAQLALFCDAVKNCAVRCGGSASCPDLQAALAAARDLDEFCADVDVAIGVNVVAAEGKAFAGSRIRTLAEAAGFKLEPDGVFRLRDGQRRTLVTLDNHEPAPFIPEQIAGLATSGITLLLDVPLVEDGVNTFDRMVEIAQSLATSLGGNLVDDNRATLNAAGIARIRQQLAAIQAKMEARGICAGGALATRLFS